MLHMTSMGYDMLHDALSRKQTVVSIPLFVMRNRLLSLSNSMGFKIVLWRNTSKKNLSTNMPAQAQQILPAIAYQQQHTVIPGGTAQPRQNDPGHPLLPLL